MVELFDQNKTMEDYEERYKEEQKLAKGSFGTVYRVTSETGV